jgi:hypothetical protein
MQVMAAVLMKPSACDICFASARDYSDDVCWGWEWKRELEVREALDTKWYAAKRGSVAPSSSLAVTDGNCA